jgi:HAD superfamily hydrolase (TIGR01484 family)
MSKYKLIALDMDGTLLDEKQQISAENREAILAAGKAGATVMFSTGRGYTSALPYAEDLGLTSPMVLVNGSEIWRTPNEIWKRTLLAADLVSEMRAVAERFDSWWWAYSTEGIFNKEKPYTMADVNSIQWLKFGYYTEDVKALPQIRSILEGWDTLQITNSHPCNIELNPKGISKGSGILEVCKLLGIDISQAIAMGDSENDISMIREAGLGVAMGNAQEGVKRIADLTTVTNEEHAVAKIINEYILQA